jgi:mannose-6-phosphate isomerase-like protein (cupin superfamily)
MLVSNLPIPVNTSIIERKKTNMSDEAWETFDIEAIAASLEGNAVQYREFLKVPALSCGVYFLPRGSEDMQSPHDEDEVYYVLNGKAQLKVGDEEREIGAGSLLYVKATETHSFFEIEEDMTLLVFFAASGK